MTDILLRMKWREEENRGCQEEEKETIPRKVEGGIMTQREVTEGSRNLGRKRRRGKKGRWSEWTHNNMETEEGKNPRRKKQAGRRTKEGKEKQLERMEKRKKLMTKVENGDDDQHGGVQQHDDQYDGASKEPLSTVVGKLGEVTIQDQPQHDDQLQEALSEPDDQANQQGLQAPNLTFMFRISRLGEKEQVMDSQEEDKPDDHHQDDMPGEEGNEPGEYVPLIATTNKDKHSLCTDIQTDTMESRSYTGLVCDRQLPGRTQLTTNCTNTQTDGLTGIMSIEMPTDDDKSLLPTDQTNTRDTPTDSPPSYEMVDRVDCTDRTDSRTNLEIMGPLRLSVTDQDEQDCPHVHQHDHHNHDQPNGQSDLEYKVKADQPALTDSPAGQKVKANAGRGDYQQAGQGAAGDGVAGGVLAVEQQTPGGNPNQISILGWVVRGDKRPTSSSVAQTAAQSAVEQRQQGAEDTAGEGGRVAKLRQTFERAVKGGNRPMGDRRIASGKRRTEGKINKKVQRDMANTMVGKMEVVRGKVQQKLKLFEGFITVGVGGDENVYGERVSRKRRQSGMQEGDSVTSASKRKKNEALPKQKELFSKKRGAI